MKHVRIKARVPAGLWEDVKRCAGAVDCALEDWTFAVCRDFDRGKFGVPDLSNSEKGTRVESVTPWVKVPVGFDLSALRCALRAGVEYVKPRIHVPEPVVFNGFVISGRGGVVKVEPAVNTRGATFDRR